MSVAERSLPGLGLHGFWPEGTDHWGDDMDSNLRELSVLCQGAVKSALAAVPGSPAAGDIHILTSAPNLNTVAVFDGDAGAEAWVYLTPKDGWVLWNKGTQSFYQYTVAGGGWAEVSSGGGGGGGGSGGTVTRWTIPFTGTGASQDITDARLAGLMVDDVIVNVAGVFQETTDYTIVGNKLTITTNGNGDAGEIRGLSIVGASGHTAVGAHRYWALYLIGSAGDAYTAIAEIEMAATPGGAAQAISGVTAAPVGNNSLANLFDGNASTMWYVQAPCLLIIDMGAPVNVQEIRLVTRNDGFTSQSPVALIAAYSDDGHALSVISFINEPGAVATAGDKKTFPIPINMPGVGGGGGSSSIGSHRYWGLFNMVCDFGGLQLQAIRWTLSGGSPVYPTHYYASSRFNTSGTYDPDNMLDDTSTYWAAAALNGWLYGDFTTPQSFDQVSLEPVAAALASSPQSGIIMYSDDGKSWLPAATFAVSDDSAISQNHWVAATFIDFAIPLTK